MTTPGARPPTTQHLATEPSLSDVITEQAGQAVRASDGERDQVAAQLQRHFADGRLTQAELEERVGAALAARTRDQLRALTADLPGADVQPAQQLMALDPCLLCLLLCCSRRESSTGCCCARRGIAVEVSTDGGPAPARAAPPKAWHGVHKALADPLRIRLVEWLMERPRSARELADCACPPTVSTTTSASSSRRG